MALVDPEYRNEFAALATWISVFLPGRSGTSLEDSPSSRSGSPSPSSGPSRRSPAASSRRCPRPSGGPKPTPVTPSALAYWLAVAGLIAFGVALAASVALYLQEGRVERALPADPATVQGGVLLAAGVAFGAATVRSVTSQPGLVVPVGAPFLLAFGAVLIAGKQSE